MEIRRLNDHDAQIFWQFRMFALESEPWSFVESPEELRRIPIETYAERLRTGDAENFVVGAFLQGTLVGTVGFYQEAPVKRRHKGHIWGVFVAPSARKQGVARALLNHTIEAARSIPGLDQIFLIVSVPHESARRLYHSLGFRSFGIEARGLKIGARSMDEEHMVLDLAAPSV
ncbi:MAG: GNAT family N-acetyltransferase [Candidatus Acidiferrum sp.]